MELLLSPAMRDVAVDRNIGHLDWPPGRIGELQVAIVNPHVQIEIKEMPVWVPGRPSRPKDAEDIARLRQALESPIEP